MNRSKTGPALNGGLLVALVAILAIVALVTQPPTPPSVAEFAPQAVEQITDAPNNQSSRFGAGEGEGASGESEGGGSGVTAPSSIDAARVRRCVGNPPRQIEDPQSPPCAPYFEGNNGGATWQGVTRDEVRIFRAYGPTKLDQVYADFFNKRFEFYGRKLVILGRDSGGVAGGDPRPRSGDPTVQKALAIEADEEHRVFGSLGFFLDTPDSSGYYQTLSERRIVGVKVGGRPYVTSGFHRGMDPFYWEVLSTSDEQQRHLAEWICNSLSGGTAAYAGPALRTTPRKFGVAIGVLQSGSKADGKELIDRLSSCGEAPVLADVLDYDPPSSGGSAVDRRNENARMFSRFSDFGVTSIVCLCAQKALAFLTAGATDTSYFPEWLISAGINHAGEAATGGTPYSPSQLQHMIGLYGYDKINPLTDQPWYWALKEAAPPDWRHPFNATPEERSEIVRDSTRYRYREFLLLASGIQLAGPRLTPQTFAQGLRQAKFPNPGCGGPPYYQACVGLDDGDHTMASDMAMMWWDDGAESHERTGNTGAWCYVHNGARFKQGSWPRGPQPFQDRTKQCR